MLLMWEMSLPGATEGWWQPREGAGGKHVMCWGWSTEKGEKLETKIPAALGERFVSSASTEQHCTQEIESCCHWEWMLTSTTMK